ncbi:MAG TPA: tetratricopeptide repeat protein, partial [Ktedonobacterales bacterium]|nr:tetratricopeptide repeat protein [Ktedonobacterales bacterium]
MADHAHLTRRVFISSTSVDLRAHRERVRDTLLSLGLFPVGMEQFGAQGSGDATSVSTSKVAGCDVYLGIFAWRYGYVPAGTPLSVTHQEYEEAARLGMPRYVLVADPATEAPDGPEALYPAAVRDPEHCAELDAFRAELLRAHVVDFFTTPEDLAVRVATALHSYILQLQREELAAGPRAPHTLPPRAAAFVGREAELPALCEMLRAGRGSGQAVAIAGMAGAGKTALAAEALHALDSDAGAFPGGTTWVRCEGRSGQPGLTWLYDQLLGAWNSTLAPEEAARARTPDEEIELRERALSARLQPAGQTPQSALVLLDHVERDLPLGRALGTLAPLGISVLIAARHEPASPRLRLFPLDVLGAAPATQLFAVRYADRGGDWEPARDEAAAAAVVEALGRLPLAIELAAARAARAHTGVAALAGELTEADRLGRLRDPLEPTRGVRYAFEQSLALLNPIQRARFAALGLPDGPDWPRPTIERLLSAAHGAAVDPASAPPGDDLEVLAALSLVGLAAPEGGAATAPRVRLHPLLRDLAREEWARQPGETQDACLSALLASVADLVHAQPDDFAVLAREEDLIAGTLRRAAQAGSQPREVGAVVTALDPYLDVGGHWRLGVELSTLQLAAYQALGDQAGAATALNNRGYLAQRLGRYAEATSDAEQALALRRALGDVAGQGETLGNLGALARSQGQTEQAGAYYEQALALRRESHDRQGEGTTLNNLGAVASDLEQLPEAVRYHEQALELLREVGDRRGQGIALNNLGELASRMGRPDAAMRAYEQALTLLRAAGDRATEGAALNNLGNLARAQGQQEAAASYYTQALAIRRALGDRIGEGTTLHNQGVLLGSMGRGDEATHAFEQALG